MVFENAVQFSDFLRGEPQIMEILPWGSELINYCDAINRGCGCKKQVRENRAESTYKDLIQTIIMQDDGIQHFIKKFSKLDTITFKSKGELIYEIK